MQAITLWKHRNALANVSVLGPVLGSHSCPLDSNGSDVSQILNSSADNARTGGRAGGSERSTEPQSSIKSQENNNKTHKGQMLGVADSGDKTQTDTPHWLHATPKNFKTRDYLFSSTKEIHYSHPAPGGN